MGIADQAQNRLQVKNRIDSVTRQAPADFRSGGAIAALQGLGSRFAQNNRRLLNR
jgi:hypothetical protein